MKQLLILLMVCFAFAGCNDYKDDKGNVISNFGVKVIVVNECQYVLYIDATRGGTTMAHAGNCNNPIHQS